MHPLLLVHEESDALTSGPHDASLRDGCQSQNLGSDLLKTRHGAAARCAAMADRGYSCMVMDNHGRPLLSRMVVSRILWYSLSSFSILITGIGELMTY